MTALAVRSAGSMSAQDLRESAMRRVSALAARHGADSPEVRAALTRWGRLLDARTATERDITALATAVGVAPALLTNATAERARHTHTSPTNGA